MNGIEAKELNIENLPQVKTRFSFGAGLRVQGVAKTKRKKRNLAKAHLQGRMRNGIVYYYYRRGTDKEIYLGSAETILSMVREYRECKGIGLCNHL